MLHIHELERAGIDTSTDIYNTAFRDNRLKHDIFTFEEEQGISLILPSISSFDQFELEMIPCEGYYKDKKVIFEVTVPEFFPNEPYKIRCKTSIFHPNIDLQGHVCLNILREDWMPSIDLSQIACSLLFLLTEPNPHDPLNEEAGEMMLSNPEEFQRVIQQM